MSNFEGEYFRYDVGLVNEDVEYVEDIKPLNKTCKFVTFTAETGTLNSVEVLEFTVNGLGIDDEHNLYIITNSLGEKPYTGSYNIRARMSYTTTDNQQITKTHMFSLPFDTLAYTCARTLYGKIRCGPFPMSKEYKFALTGDESKLKIKVQFHVFGLFPYLINDIEISDDEHTLTFPCGFATKAYDSTNHSFDVDLKYTTCGDSGEMVFEGGFSLSGAETEAYVSNVNYANIYRVILSGSITTVGDNKFFNIAANSDVKFECAIVSFDALGANAGHYEGMGAITATVGDTDVQLAIKEYASGFQFSFQDWINILVGDSGHGTIDFQDVSAQTIISFNLNNLSLSARAGNIIFELDEENTYIGKIDGYVECVANEGTPDSKALHFYTMFPYGPKYQMELRYTPGEGEEGYGGGGEDDEGNNNDNVDNTGGEGNNDNNDNVDNTGGEGNNDNNDNVDNTGGEGNNDNNDNVDNTGGEGNNDNNDNVDNTGGEGNNVMQFMKGNLKEVGFRGSVKDNKITFSAVELRFDDVELMTSDAEQSYEHLQLIFNIVEPVEFSFEGDENNRIIIRINESTLLKLETSDEWITSGIYDGLYLPSGTIIPLKFLADVEIDPETGDEPKTEKVYLVDSGRLWSYPDSDYANYRSIPLFWDTFMNSNRIDFLASNSEGVRTSTTAISANHYVYDNMMASGMVLDHTTDAGFVIPVIDNGKYVKKYIRISDLYDEIVKYDNKKHELPPALGDRLHACEVALDETCSGTLANEGSADATRLYNIKNKWCAVDIQGFA